MLFFQKKFNVLLLCALLPSCSRQPLAPEVKQEIEQVSAISFLGADFTIDVISRSVIFPKEKSLNAASWKIDETFRLLLAEGVKERGKSFQDLKLAPNELEKALSVRESRWKKTVGEYSQPMLDLLFQKANEQGVRYLFIISPNDQRQKFSLHKGNMGIYCYDRKLLTSRAYAYFFFDFSFWDVKARKRIFRESVNPEDTKDQTFAECREVADLKEPLTDLAEPVHHTMRLLVGKLFAKMGWEKSAP